ncbi:MAG: hypothetical protein CM1200mP26_18170 [Acidimicrobiales bacterium]|nr:MAG: hypothetical protein CM1200mP26_18170 [Acidimicrobiales bacterium]
MVLLRESNGERMLPIFIGLPEAKAIGLAMAGQDPPRPMTHDLLATFLGKPFSVAVEQVVVTDLRDRTFFAEVTLRGPGGIEVVSARPSDAIALAVRTGAPVLVAEEVSMRLALSHLPAMKVQIRLIHQLLRPRSRSSGPFWTR